MAAAGFLQGQPGDPSCEASLRECVAACYSSDDDFKSRLAIAAESEEESESVWSCDIAPCSLRHDLWQYSFTPPPPSSSSSSASSNFSLRPPTTPLKLKSSPTTSPSPRASPSPSSVGNSGGGVTWPIDEACLLMGSAWADVESGLLELPDLPEDVKESLVNEIREGLTQLVNEDLLDLPTACVHDVLVEEDMLANESVLPVASPTASKTAKYAKSRRRRTQSRAISFSHIGKVRRIMLKLAQFKLLRRQLARSKNSNDDLQDVKRSPGDNRDADGAVGTHFETEDEHDEHDNLNDHSTFHPFSYTHGTAHLLTVIQAVASSSSSSSSSSSTFASMSSSPSALQTTLIMVDECLQHVMLNDAEEVRAQALVVCDLLAAYCPSLCDHFNRHNFDVTDMAQIMVQWMSVAGASHFPSFVVARLLDLLACHRAETLWRSKAAVAQKAASPSVSPSAARPSPKSNQRQQVPARGKSIAVASSAQNINQSSPPPPPPPLYLAAFVFGLLFVYEQEVLERNDLYVFISQELPLLVTQSRLRDSLRVGFAAVISARITATDASTDAAADDVRDSGVASVVSSWSLALVHRGSMKFLHVDALQQIYSPSHSKPGHRLTPSLAAEARGATSNLPPSSSSKLDSKTSTPQSESKQSTKSKAKHITSSSSNAVSASTMPRYWFRMLPRASLMALCLSTTFSFSKSDADDVDAVGSRSGGLTVGRHRHIPSGSLVSESGSSTGSSENDDNDDVGKNENEQEENDDDDDDDDETHQRNDLGASASQKNADQQRSESSRISGRVLCTFFVYLIAAVPIAWMIFSYIPRASIYSVDPVLVQSASWPMMVRLHVVSAQDTGELGISIKPHNPGGGAVYTHTAEPAVFSENEIRLMQTRLDVLLNQQTSTSAADQLEIPRSYQVSVKTLLSTPVVDAIKTENHAPHDIDDMLAALYDSELGVWDFYLCVECPNDDYIQWISRDDDDDDMPAARRRKPNAQPQAEVVDGPPLPKYPFPPWFMGKYRHGWMPFPALQFDHIMNHALPRLASLIKRMHVHPQIFGEYPHRTPSTPSSVASSRAASGLLYSSQPFSQLRLSFSWMPSLARLEGSSVEESVSAAPNWLDWNFTALSAPYLTQPVSKLSAAFPIAIDTDIRPFDDAHFAHFVTLDDRTKRFVVADEHRASLIQSLSKATSIDESVSSARLHILLYVPSPQFSPLSLWLPPKPNPGAAPRKGAKPGPSVVSTLSVIESWGGVLVVNPMRMRQSPSSSPSSDNNNNNNNNNSSSLVHGVDWHLLFSECVTVLRDLLGLSIGGADLYDVDALSLSQRKVIFLPSPEDGFTDWEMDTVLHHMLSRSVAGTIRTLTSFHELVARTPHMPTPQIPADQLQSAANLCAQALCVMMKERLSASNHSSSVLLQMKQLCDSSPSLSSSSSSSSYVRPGQHLRDAVKIAHQSWLNAREGFAHPSMIPLQHFSQEHIYAVFAPFFIPVLFHLLAASIKHFRRARQPQPQPQQQQQQK